MINSLHNHDWIRRWKKFENRSTFAQVMGTNLVSHISTHGVYRYRRRETSARWKSVINLTLVVDWLTSVAELAAPAAVTLALVAADALAVHAAPSSTDRCLRNNSSATNSVVQRGNSLCPLESRAKTIRGKHRPARLPSWTPQPVAALWSPPWGDSQLVWFDRRVMLHVCFAVGPRICAVFFQK